MASVQNLIEKNCFELKNAGKTDRDITKVFCCDLLSIAMGKAPGDSAWVTVMGNRNTLAVASLADVSCVILAEGARLRTGRSGLRKKRGDHRILHRAARL